MTVFISGGCKNGKSYVAQRLAKSMRDGALNYGALYYVATMKSTGCEDDERIARHIREREGMGFVTVEQPTDIGGIAEKCDRGGAFLIDSLTALLANEMFPPDGSVDGLAAQRIIDGIARLVCIAGGVVFVSDYIYSDAYIYDEYTEKYRKSLAEIDRAAAAACDAVLEVVYSGIIVHKGYKKMECEKRFREIFDGASFVAGDYETLY